MEDLIKTLKDYKVAVVHDWLNGMRGGEKVLEALLEILPDADLFTLLHEPGSVSERIENRKIVTSFIDRLPYKTNHYRHYLPLFPTAIELFDFKEYDIIISTSHCVAKGVRTPPNTLHISYLHSPMRYVWDMYEDYFSPDQIGWLSRRIIPMFANYLRMWDVTSSNRVDHFIANSAHVAKRIMKYYRRSADVIHPPVDTDLLPVSAASEEYYLIVSALVPYKRVDLAVRTFNRMGKRLIVIGDGPEKADLHRTGAKNIEFLDWLPNEQLYKYYAGCKALIFPGEEDFGIVPVEAQSCGKPVIAFRKGGTLETVIGLDNTNAGKCTGIFFNRQTEEDLIAAVELCEAQNWDTKFIHQHAATFGKDRFKSELARFLFKKIEEYFKTERTA